MVKISILNPAKEETVKFNLFLCTFIVLFLISCKKEPIEIDNGLSEPKPAIDISIDSLSTLASDIPPDYYTDLTFVNDTTGYAISNSGRIIKTTNGGKNWEDLNSPTTTLLRHVQFLDENTGFVIGRENQEGIFLKTLDGGRTWDNQALNSSQAPSAICFLNNQIGYITGSNLFINSKDGGENWHHIENNTFRIYGDIKFKNSEEGIVTIGGGAYLKTIDGGATWDSIKINITNGVLGSISYTTYKTFFSTNAKLVILDSNNQENIIELPLMLKILFLNEYQAVGIGQHYNKVGYFPYGDIFITNDTWNHYVKKTYTPSDAYVFTAIAKMSANKIMILGTGFQATKIVILHI